MMLCFSRTLLISLVFINIGANIFSQSALDINAYGVWSKDTGYNPADPNYDYLLGMSVEGGSWDQIQPNDSASFDWSGMQLSIDIAADRGQFLYLGVGVGPDAPAWIYNNGVPKVYTDDADHSWPYYPYYIDPDYKRFLYKFLDELGTFIYSQPPDKLKAIVFIQVKTGCTGDEVAYKGTPYDTQYDLPKSGQLWSDYRLGVFDKYREIFFTGEHKIPLLFNDTDPIDFPTEWNWVITNIGSGFGIKEGALVRGHHLTEERIVVETWNPYLVNPKGLALFSRSEMDQTWTRPLYQINIELGFYWGILNALNQGLSVNDVSNSALDMAKNNPSVQNTYRLFNKYADQIYPESSSRAFIALHEGLDASDVQKFPEDKYGSANSNNESRYAAICNDPVYSSRGAKMDDLNAATKGQVYQRKSQTGYNDAGWEIWPGNYSRFMTQIDPENTSIGLFRIGGIINTGSPIYNRFARSFETSTGKNAMYFQLHEDLFNNSQDTVTFIVTYLDKINGSSWSLKYDAGESELKEAFAITCNGSGTWKTQTVTVPDAVFNRNGPQGSDFALINTDSKDDIFHMIEVEKGIAWPIRKKSNNALLESITWPDIPDSISSGSDWNNKVIPNFNSKDFSYEILLPSGTENVPALAANTKDVNAIVTSKRATNVRGSIEERTTEFTVIAEDGKSKQTYTIGFEVETSVSEDTQPFTAEPLFSRLVYREFFNNNYIEISNPGTEPTDLSHYLIAMADSMTPDQIILDSLPFESRYNYYIPGYDYPTTDTFLYVPGLFIKDPAVNPVIGAGGSFVIGHIEDPDEGDRIHAEDCDIIINRELNFTTDVKLIVAGPNSIMKIGWMEGALCLFKILNDSITYGTKAINDPADFKLIDVFGDYDGSPWSPAGSPLLNEDNKWNITRKPPYWQGDTLPGTDGSWGSDEGTSEWECYSKDDYSAMGYGGTESHLKLSENIGSHSFDPVNDYKSTISSILYNVSEGYETPQQISDIPINTSFDVFLANIVKRHEDQLIELRAGNGSSKTGADIIVDGDTITVTSATGQNITKYGLITTIKELSSDAVLVAVGGSGYTINHSETTGSITGILFGSSIQQVLEKIMVPEKAKLNVIDMENQLVPLLTLNSNGSYSNTTAGANLFFEVIAEDNYTTITYQLQFNLNEDEAFAWSDICNVDQDKGLVTQIPEGVNVHMLFSYLKPNFGATIKLFDRAGLERLQGPVDYEDHVVVTSANGSVEKQYRLNLIGEILGSEAYITSGSYDIDQENYKVGSIPLETAIAEFLDNITAAPYACITLLNSNQTPVDSGNIFEGYTALVNSGDGLKEVVYSFSFYEPDLVVNADMRSVRLYPNPLSDHLTIEGIAPHSSISIINIYGSTLLNMASENSLKVELATGDLIPGIYMIRISSNHNSLLFKVVKK